MLGSVSLLGELYQESQPLWRNCPIGVSLSRLTSVSVGLVQTRGTLYKNPESRSQCISLQGFVLPNYLIDVYRCAEGNISPKLMHDACYLKLCIRHPGVTKQP
jgi:hypothetical protein